MPDEPIRLVCFDLGGVLVRICRSWAEGCEVTALEIRGDVDALCAGDAWHDLNAAYQRGEMSETAFAERFSTMLEGLYSPDEIMTVHRAWVRGEYAGVDEVVDRLRDAGVLTAVLSNTCHEHWRHLPRYPAVMRLDHRVGSHEVAVRKPDEAAYRIIEERTGARGGQILFFDDLEENVAAARALGWRAKRIDPLGAPAAQITEVLSSAGVFG